MLICLLAVAFECTSQMGLSTRPHHTCSQSLGSNICRNIIRSCVLTATRTRSILLKPIEHTSAAVHSTTTSHLNSVNHNVVTNQTLPESPVLWIKRINRIFLRDVLFFEGFRRLFAHWKGYAVSERTGRGLSDACVGFQGGNLRVKDLVMLQAVFWPTTNGSNVILQAPVLCYSFPEDPRLWFISMQLHLELNTRSSAIASCSWLLLCSSHPSTTKFKHGRRYWTTTTRGPEAPTIGSVLKGRPLRVLTYRHPCKN